MHKTIVPRLLTNQFIQSWRLGFHTHFSESLNTDVETYKTFTAPPQRTSSSQRHQHDKSHSQSGPPMQTKNPMWVVRVVNSMNIVDVPSQRFDILILLNFRVRFIDIPILFQNQRPCATTFFLYRSRCVLAHEETSFCALRRHCHCVAN